MRNVSAENLEKFLVRFAHLRAGQPDSATKMERFLEKYRSMFPPSFFTEPVERERATDRLLSSELGDDVFYAERTTDELRQDSLHMAIWGLAAQLRDVWAQPNRNDRDWYIHELRRWFYVRTEWVRSQSRVPPPPPSRTGFTLALDYLNAARARVCRNRNCLRPYFFTTKVHGNIKHCSEACETWSRKDSKERWNHAHIIPSKKPRGKRAMP